MPVDDSVNSCLLASAQLEVALSGLCEGCLWARRRGGRRLRKICESPSGVEIRQGPSDRDVKRGHLVKVLGCNGVYARRESGLIIVEKLGDCVPISGEPSADTWDMVVAQASLKKPSMSWPRQSRRIASRLARYWACSTGGAWTRRAALRDLGCSRGEETSARSVSSLQLGHSGAFKKLDVLIRGGTIALADYDENNTLIAGSI